MFFILAKLSGNINAKFQFCGALKMNVDHNVKSLEISYSYSTLYLDFSKNLSATFDITNSFSSFKNNSNFTISEGDSNKRDYGNKSGYSGKAGSGDSKITIHSSFGSVVAGHDLQLDTSGKKKTATI